jgi:hypothetical protein
MRVFQALVTLAALCALAFYVLSSLPPREIVIEAGPIGGTYDEHARAYAVVALPLNRLCLNLCGGTVAFSLATILDRPGRTWRV